MNTSQESSKQRTQPKQTSSTLLKRCSKCDTHKPLSEFNKQKKTKDGLQYWCRVCTNREGLLWHEKNRDRLVEKMREYTRKLREENPNYDRDYHQANKEVSAARTAKRRARKLNATPLWLTKEHHLQIKALYAKAKLLTEFTGVEHHVDHIMPLRGRKVCGLHVPWNLQVLEGKENMRKSNKV